MGKRKNILVAFYGDDFTGSTDALEFICRAGARAMLFIEPPTVQQLAGYPDLDAYGVAGKTRSLSPEEMERTLLPAFTAMKKTGAAHIHYKVCSTFDSSASVGSIGRAIDCGATVFKNAIIPVVGGTPALGRFCVFGNLFARMGTGKEGKVYRIDRHPSMSKHPVTPAEEADLRLHLGKQTLKKIGLIDIGQQEKNIPDWACDEEVILLDILYEEQLEKIGAWLDLKAGSQQQFSVGSSGIEMALGKHWNSTGQLVEVTQWPSPTKAEPLLVLSGSCSPVTAGQIAYAKSIGFEEVIIDAINVCEVGRVNEPTLNRVFELLGEKKNVIVHTGEEQFNNLSSEKLGKVLGLIAKASAERSLVKRIVIAGGDTSSYAARAMEIEAVEMLGPIVTGAPLCKAFSANKHMNRMEVNFKGGQVGSENYFELF